MKSCSKFKRLQCSAGAFQQYAFQQYEKSFNLAYLTNTLYRSSMCFKQSKTVQQLGTAGTQQNSWVQTDGFTCKNILYSWSERQQHLFSSNTTNSPSHTLYLLVCKGAILSNFPAPTPLSCKHCLMFWKLLVYPTIGHAPLAQLHLCQKIG